MWSSAGVLPWHWEKRRREKNPPLSSFDDNGGLKPPISPLEWTECLYRRHIRNDRDVGVYEMVFIYGEHHLKGSFATVQNRRGWPFSHGVVDQKTRFSTHRIIRTLLYVLNAGEKKVRSTTRWTKKKITTNHDVSRKRLNINNDYHQYRNKQTN